MKSQWLPGLLLINMKQRLLTIALNSISMNLCLPYWKSQGISCGLESGHPVNFYWDKHLCAAVIKQYNLVLVEGLWRSSTGKVTAGWTANVLEITKRKGKEKDRKCRWPQAWQKVMAAYCWGWLKKLTVGWLPVHWDQLWAQRSVTSMGELCLHLLLLCLRFSCKKCYSKCLCVSTDADITIFDTHFRGCLTLVFDCWTICLCTTPHVGQLAHSSLNLLHWLDEYINSGVPSNWAPLVNQCLWAPCCTSDEQWQQKGFWCPGHTSFWRPFSSVPSVPLR